MLRGLIAVLFDPGDFGFEQSNPRGQFVLRIRRKVLACEPAGGVSFGAGEVGVFHAILNIAIKLACCQSVCFVFALLAVRHPAC